MFFKKKPTIAIFCGSQKGNKTIYRSQSKKIAKILSKESYPIIYGGGRTGLMGTISDTIKKSKGKIIGIFPKFLNFQKLAQGGLYKFYTVKTLSNRKKIMINKSDVFLILPGGFGTLDELLEILTIKQLGLSNKPIIIFNIDGFWDPLKNLFLYLKKEGFINHKDIKYVFWANSTDEILNFLDNNFS